MAKTKSKNKTQDDLFGTLRARGLRKRVARTVSSAMPQKNSKAPKVVRKTTDDLRSVLSELEYRAKGGPKRKRRAAGKKAARTRKAKAAKRSAAAKKGAKKRAAA